MQLDKIIICDDIRTEIGNKLSLMGTYDDQINFTVNPNEKNSWPKVMRLAFFIKIYFEIGEIQKISKFKFIVDYNGTKKELGEGIVQKDRPNELAKMVFTIVVNTFEFSSPGEFKVGFEFYDNKNNLLNELFSPEKITVKETANNNIPFIGAGKLNSPT